MLNRLLFILTVTMFFSCGKDVVEIIDTPVPNEPQEIFEVNVIGHSTDVDHNFLENVDLTINGNVINTDLTSFFVENKVLVGKEGSVIKAEKIGYLPVYKRFYHHSSLEDVVTNITMFEAPSTQGISVAGGDVTSDDGSLLTVNNGALSQSSDIIFYSSFDMVDQVDFDPFIVTDESVKILDDQALFFIESTTDLEQNGTVSISFDNNKIENLESLGLYKYNESIQTWQSVYSDLQESNGQIVLTLESLGWWAVGSEIETIYGTVQFNQVDESSSSISPISDAEVVFSRLEDRNLNEHLFTNSKGEISKYFPIAKENTVLIDNGQIEVLLDSGFSIENREQSVQLEEQVIHQVTAEIFDCDLNRHNGYVTILSGNQYVIKRIDSGDINIYSNTSNENLELRFYDLNEDLLTSRIIATENISGNIVKLVACSPVMLVEYDQSVVQNFDQCKVRVKPIESFIVGEGLDDKLFFIAFKGDTVGQYEGLVYTDELASFTVNDIEKEVQVDIMIYDKISRTIAGVVDGKYKNGEDYKVSFIGNVEE